MALQFTPYTLRQAYKFLDATAPFKNWNLPDADDVVFRVVKDQTLRGWYRRRPKHTIAISTGCVGHTYSLIQTMAHEMIHVYEEHAGICKANVEHSAAFKKLAARVCKEHGFDPKMF